MCEVPRAVIREFLQISQNLCRGQRAQMDREFEEELKILENKKVHIVIFLYMIMKKFVLESFPS